MENNTPDLLDIIKNINRAQEIQGTRTGVRDNPTGETMQAHESEDYSTHLMRQADNYAFPMLYQLFDGWKEFNENDWKEAMDYAEREGELYEFGSEEEARKWAEGRWKQENLESFINELAQSIVNR